MTWKLFLDDDCDNARNPAITVENPEWRTRMNLPHTPPDTGMSGEWILARSFAEAVHAMSAKGLPGFVSFDHDLGDGKDGIAVAHWMIESDMDGNRIPQDFAFEVHSGNPVGRENIRRLLDNYLFFRAKAHPEP